MICSLKIITQFLVIAIVAASCGFEKREAFSIAESDLPQIVDYNFYVRPILSDKCFACHGSDAAKRKAGLRLDKADNA